MGPALAWPRRGVRHWDRRRQRKWKRVRRRAAEASRAMLSGTAVFLVCVGRGRSQLSLLACAHDDWTGFGAAFARDMANNRGARGTAGATAPSNRATSV